MACSRVRAGGTLLRVKSRVTYVELKTGFSDDGPAWIGWVSFSKTGRTVYAHGRRLRRIPGGGVQGNHFDVVTGEPCRYRGESDGRRLHELVLISAARARLRHRAPTRIRCSQRHRR
jgi:hypothetical protein